MHPHRPRRDPDKPRLSSQLTLADVCRLLAEADASAGWVGADGAPTRTALRRIKRRLQRAERSTGRRIIFGGGRRGSTCWTTRDALRRCGLLDDFAIIVGEVGSELASLRDRIETVEEKTNAMGRVIAEMQVSR